MLILVELGARGRATQAPGNRSAEGGNIDRAGGINQLKPICSRHMEPRTPYWAKKYPTTRNTVFILLVFKSGVGTSSIGVLGVP